MLNWLLKARKVYNSICFASFILISLPRRVTSRTCGRGTLCNAASISSLEIGNRWLTGITTVFISWCSEPGLAVRTGIPVNPANLLGTIVFRNGNKLWWECFPIIMRSAEICFAFLVILSCTESPKLTQQSTFMSFRFFSILSFKPSSRFDEFFISKLTCCRV